MKCIKGIEKSTFFSKSNCQHFHNFLSSVLFILTLFIHRKRKISGWPVKNRRYILFSDLHFLSFLFFSFTHWFHLYFSGKQTLALLLPLLILFFLWFSMLSMRRSVSIHFAGACMWTLIRILSTFVIWPFCFHRVSSLPERAILFSLITFIIHSSNQQQSSNLAMP